MSGDVLLKGWKEFLSMMDSSSRRNKSICFEKNGFIVDPTAHAATQAGIRFLDGLKQIKELHVVNAVL